MPRMIRKQVYIERRHDQILKRRAREQGVTEAEIIRAALDAVATGAGRTPATGDVTAAQQGLAFMRSLAVRRSRRPAGRTWTRESLYESRTSRWAKS